MIRRFPRLKKLLLLAAAMAACFVLVEAAARLLLGSGYPMNREDPAIVRERVLNRVFASRIFRRASDKELCYELIPGGRAEILGQVYTINGHGFRGPDLSVKKSPDTKRIALLGDSFVFGWGADDGHTISAFMERILRAGGQDAASYEVINSGVPGFNTAQMKEYLLRKTLALDLDFLVLFVSANDIVSDYLHFNTLFEGLYADFLPLPYGVKSLLWRVSAAYRFLVQHHKRAREQARRNGDFLEKDLAFLRREVGAIEEAARKQGVGFLVVILPMLEPFDAYPYAADHEAMHRALEGLDVVDLLPSMQNFDVETLWFRPDDHHLNRRANRAVARLVLSSLADRGVVRLLQGTLPADPLADALYRPGDLVIADLDADPGALGGHPGAIFRMTPEGKEAALVSSDPAFREPVDLVFDPVGNLLVLDNAADPDGRGWKGAVFRVDRFTGKASVVLTSDRFVLPNALLLDGDGRLFISAKRYDPEGLGGGTGCLFVYGPEQRRLDVLASGRAFVAPGAIAFAPGGKLYFLDADANPKGYTGRGGRPNTPGVLFEVDRGTGEFHPLIEFRETVSPVGMIPLPDGRLIVIDANADVLMPGFWLGGLLMADPSKKTCRFIHCSREFRDPTRGDLGPDGAIYFTDSNADPLKLGPDAVGKGVQGTGPGAIWRFDLEKNTLELLYSGKPLVNPISLKIAPAEADF